MNKPAFDSRNTEYKWPFGAVKSGTEVCFNVKLHRDALSTAVFLLCLKDSEKNYVWHEMPYSHDEDDNRVYSLRIAFTEGLYFYKFVFDSAYGRKALTRLPDAVACISPDGADWQQTVYRSGFSTPYDFCGGIFYQIFPDRFYYSGSEKTGVPADRYINKNWGDKPEYRQSADKNRLCNDYFCGDLKGITQKLDYISRLGVSIIYLNPIFEAHSNHRYNTADYLKIDPLLGDEEDFKELCKKAKEKGIKIMLDGVFSHTGDDSIYFNKYRRYGDSGAYNSQDCEYFSWYKFNSWPDDCKSWWGVPTLPEVIEESDSFCDFITGNGGVIDHWLDLGASGFRLDVADELPDSFLEKVRTAVKRHPGALLIGEVWEDATTKISYGSRRKFLYGNELDSVMNYPFRSAIIDFVKLGDSCTFVNRCMDICENYPPEALHLLMNHIGTHDTNRILTELGTDEYREDREWQANKQLTRSQLDRALLLLQIAVVIQYTLPGMPSLYYGDEAQSEGYNDPFCRSCYPWGHENHALIRFYQKLGAARRKCAAFKDGGFIPYLCDRGALIFIRQGECFAVTVINCNPFEYCFKLPDEAKTLNAVFGHISYNGELTLPPYGYELYV